jgi:D-alanyl-D-alanine carboxypeptidase
MVMGLKKGEKLTVESLLKGMLIGSANDAAMVLARHHSEGLAGFIKQMNKKAEELNLDNTHFTNPVGIDQYNHQTTAHDLVILTYEAIENPVFKRIVGVEETVVENLNGEDPALEIEADKVYNLENINELIGEVEGLKGVKTGWTSSAGECLISWTERDGNSILMALFGSQDRFGETEILTEWIFNNYQWEEADFD